MATKSSSCGCSAPIPAQTVSIPPGAGQKPPGGFFSSPRVKYVTPPAVSVPKGKIAPDLGSQSSASACDVPAVPSPPVGGRNKEPFFWGLLKKLTCAASGRLLVVTQNCFLNWFRPNQSGPVQYDHDTGQVNAGPMREIAQLVSDDAQIERGYAALLGAEKAVVDGQEVWLLRHGYQQLNYTQQGRLAVVDVNEDGQIRYDLLVPPDAVDAVNAPAGTQLLGFIVSQPEGACGKVYTYQAINLPAQPSGDAVTLTPDNIGDYKLQVWKDGKPYYATIPGNWFNEEEE